MTIHRDEVSVGTVYSPELAAEIVAGMNADHDLRHRLDLTTSAYATAIDERKALAAALRNLVANCTMPRDAPDVALTWRLVDEAQNALDAFDAGVAHVVVTAKEREPLGELVHILHEGFALCSFDRRPPYKWPKGHIWVSGPDAETATCSECVRVHTERKVFAP